MLKKYQEFIPKSFFFFKRYSWDLFKKDLVAGLTVGIVTIPLAMAFAMAAGVSPERGLYTAIVAGFLISFLGGSRVQIGGPTGAFVVVIYTIIQKYGYDGLALATLMAAVMLIGMGVLRLGSFIKYIPHPLITGIITGIAVTLFSSQMKDFFGLNIEHLPANFIAKWQACSHAFPPFNPTTTLVSLATLACIIVVRKKLPSIPWGIISIVLATLVCWGLHIPGETIASRFGEMPRTLPFPSLAHIDLSRIVELFPCAITIAILAGIESLLSAVISDRMMGGRHKPNCELIAQGIANIGSMLFGGIPATAAIARTATNVKTGARTPFAGMSHAGFICIILFFFAPVVGMIPLGALAALLVMVAWNMSEMPHFIQLFKAPKSDILLLLTSFCLTVFIDITVALEVGMILAACLFMKRMIDRKQVIVPSQPNPTHVERGIEMYDVHGPFFFGVAHHLKAVYEQREKIPKTFVLRMTNVPSLDATGMHALHEFNAWCKKEKVDLILSHVHEDQVLILKDFGLGHLIGEEPSTERKTGV